MRWLVEFLMRLWPLNRILTAVWRYAPFPRGLRSRIMRGANDRFLVGVVVILRDESERIMLVRNTYHPRFPWSLPGGWMGKYEQPQECIRRELREETGYEIEVDGLVDVHADSRLPSVDLICRGRVVGGDFRSSAEVVEARYFSHDELPDGLTPMHSRMLGTTSSWTR